MTLTIAGRRYRWRGLKRRRHVPTKPQAQIPSVVPVCPVCRTGNDGLDAAGQAEVGPLIMREPVRCRTCGYEFVVAWRTPEALRDWYYAKQAGVTVKQFRRYKAEAMRLYREGDGPRGA